MPHARRWVAGSTTGPRTHTCESAWGHSADWRANALSLLAQEGSIRDADSHRSLSTLYCP